jgi:cholesterol transport system auxiliary component
MPGAFKAPRALTAAALAIAFAAGLAGCVSLLPKSEPAQLYRFGADIPEAANGGASQRIPVGLAPMSFTQPASGDRLMTINGNEAAFIGGARWVAPAQDMFEEALDRAFARGAVSTRLVERRQSASTKLVLNVDVETFEARYEAGPNAAPTVVVGLRAQMIRYPDRFVIASKTFRSTQTASDNRISAIVPAYDAAVTAVLKDLTSWTDESATAARGQD